MIVKGPFGFDREKMYFHPAEYFDLDFFIAFIMIVGSSAYLRVTVPFFIPLLTIFCTTVAVVYLIKSLNEHKKLFYFVIITVFYIWAYITTYLGTKSGTLYIYIAESLAATIYVGYMIDGHAPELFDAVRNSSFVILLMNFALLLVKPGGFFGTGNTTLYFLGYRIGFTPFVLLAVVATLLYDYSVNQACSIYSLCIIAISLATVIIKDVGTGLVSLVVVLGLTVTFTVLKRDIFSIWLVYILYVIGFIAIVIFEVQMTFKPLSYILVDVLDKDVTFDNRTYVWRSALPEILNKPIIGHGIDSTLVAVFGRNTRVVTQHNQTLNIFADLGLIGFIIFAFIFIYIGIQITKLRDRRLKIIAVATVVSVLLVFFTEIQTTKINVFFILAFLANVRFLEGSNEKICVDNNT